MIDPSASPIAVRRWTGRESRALREALRLSVRDFAVRLGISDRMVSKWEAGGESICPRPVNQEALDSTLARSDEQAQARFHLLLGSDTRLWSQTAEQGGRSGAAPTSGHEAQRQGGRYALVPPRDSDLVGRDDELEHLVGAILRVSTGSGVVGVCGPGGFGKTTLVAEACHDERVLDRFDHLLWVETGERCSPARLLQLVAALVTHLGVEPPAFEDAEQAGFHLVRVLAGRRALLVVDNVWSAQEASPFLLASGSAVVVVTTRNARTCPVPSDLVRVGPMVPEAVETLVARDLPVMRGEAKNLARLCGGWPLLANVVNANLRQDVRAGAALDDAIARAERTMQTMGPDAFDVWDADQRATAIGEVMHASLRSLDEHVSLPGAHELAARYRSLAVFPPATEIPFNVLRTWWSRAFGWTEPAVDQFCRVLADRSLVSAYLGDRQAILLHDVFRSYLRRLPGEDWTDLHRSLVDSHRPDGGASWAEIDSPDLYFWRQLGSHLHQAGLHDELAEALSSPRFIIEKVLRVGHHSLVDDHAVLGSAIPEPTLTPAGTRAATAHELTGSAHLLSGSLSRHDIAATLLIQLMRTERPSAVAADELRDYASSASEDLEVRWAQQVDHGEESKAAPTDGDGHIGAVTAVAVHRRLLVSAGEDGSVRLWDLESGRLRKVLRGHTGWVFAVAISDDGDVIASAGDDGAIHLWRAATGGALGVLAGHSGRVRALAFAGPSRLLVSGSEDGTVRVWETERSVTERASLPVGVSLWSVAANATAEVVACGGEDGAVRLYDLANGRKLDEHEAHTDWVRTVAFTPDARTLASGSGDRRVLLWDTSDRRLRLHRAVGPFAARVRSLLVTGAEGSDLVVAGEKAMLQSRRDARDEAVAPVPDGIDWIRSIATAPAGRVVAGCEDGGLRIWDRRPGDGLRTLASGRNSVWSTTIAAHGTIAAVGRGDDTIELRDCMNGALLRTLSAGKPGTGRQAGRVWSIGAGGPFLAAACGDGRVRVWDTEHSDPLLMLNDDQQRSWAVAIDRNGSWLAATSGGMVRLWSLPSGRPVWTTHGHNGRIRALAVDPTGQLLLTGGGDGLLRIWSAASGTEVAALDRSTWIRAVTANDDASLVAIGFGSGLIEIVEPESGRCTRLSGHRGRVLMLALDEDHDRLVSAAADGTLRTWSLSTRAPQREVRIDASLHCACFDQPSSQLIAGSARGAVALTLTTEPRSPQR